MGLPCTWSPSLYQDLRQAGDGTATGMLKTWFNSAGWPTILGKNDHGAYVMATLRIKDEVLQDMLRDGEVPLRPGEGFGSGCKGQG